MVQIHLGQPIGDIMIHRINFNGFTNQKRVIDITKEIEVGPSPWDKYLAEKKRQKTLPKVVEKKNKK